MAVVGTGTKSQIHQTISFATQPLILQRWCTQKTTTFKVSIRLSIFQYQKFADLAR